MAITDSLTGLYNRRYFYLILDNEIERAKRYQSPLSLIMMDIDHFKLYNDTYGHISGDDCLKSIALVISNAAHRPADVAARYGGEEYMILLPQGNVETSMKIAESIRERVAQLTIELEDERVLRTTISIGISETNSLVDSNIETAINKADNALYEAKRSGKNKVCSYAESYEREES